mmetsp:Transcript_28692/g.91895  ORF Transcript_28692/g.91895 Transcript_28692/m.91895 type:complete len:217 (-) Transcript_28692:1056-1706(-)
MGQLPRRAAAGIGRALRDGVALISELPQPRILAHATEPLEALFARASRRLFPQLRRRRRIQVLLLREGLLARLPPKVGAALLVAPAWEPRRLLVLALLPRRHQQREGPPRGASQPICVRRILVLPHLPCAGGLVQHLRDGRAQQPRHRRLALIRVGGLVELVRWFEATLRCACHHLKLAAVAADGLVQLLHAEAAAAVLAPSLPVGRLEAWQRTPG